MTLPVKLNGGELERFQTGDALDLTAGGTGSTSAAGARTNLGLEIGVNVQAYSTELGALSGLGTTGILIRTAAGTYVPRALSGTAGRITVTTADGVTGSPTFDLATLADGGSGTFLKITRDSYGRVSGTTAVVAGDITGLVGSVYAPINNPSFTGTVTLAADPGNALEAATKQYVDARAAGLDPKASVKAYSTANHTLSNPATSTFGGTAVSNGDRVLIKAQSSPAENGIYIFNGSGSAMTRASDFVNGVVSSAAFTFAENDASGWVLSTQNPITIGTTGLSFVQMTGGGTYVAGNGLTLTGNSFSVAASARFTVGTSLDLVTVGTAGTYTKVTTDAYGRVTSGTSATAADVGAQASNTDLTAFTAVAGTGILVRTAASAYTTRSIAGTAGRITVTNGAATAGDPTIDLVTVGTAGTYGSVTVDAYGRVTAGSGAASVALITTTMTNAEASGIAIGQPVYVFSGDNVKKGIANATGTRRIIGLVSDSTINAAASGNIAITGLMTATTGQWDAVTGQTGGLTPDAIYYLDNATAGKMTSSAPSTGWVCPLGIALSTTRFKINIGSTVKL